MSDRDEERFRLLAGMLMQLDAKLDWIIEEMEIDDGEEEDHA